jgi:hypothetical protein
MVVVLEHYGQQESFEQYHQGKGSDMVFHIDLSTLPSRTVGYSVEEYPDEFKKSLIKAHDQRLEKDFLPWAKTRSQERRLKNGDIQMERMLQGLWRYGGHNVVMDIKVRITKPPNGKPELLVLDTLSRLW